MTVKQLLLGKFFRN